MPLRETYLYLCIRVFVNWYNWVVLNMGELPRARRTQKARISKKPTIQAVPS
jgi:hypothetical protein